jgi:hypothetical protein
MGTTDGFEAVIIAHPPIVIISACGGSSTPRLPGSIIGVSGILDRPLEPVIGRRESADPVAGDDNWGDQHDFAISRRGAPEVCQKIPALSK